MLRKRKVASNSFHLNQEKKKKYAGESRIINIIIYCLGALFAITILIWFQQLFSFITEFDANENDSTTNANVLSSSLSQQNKKVLNNAPHLIPKFTTLPAFAKIPNADKLIEETSSGDSPTMAGIIAMLQNFLYELHEMQTNLKKKRPLNKVKIIKSYFDLVSQYLVPFDKLYRDRPIFEIREDDSIFVSIAAFREHLLDQTMRYAFDNAKDPDKIFFGVVVQNCFGLNGEKLPCKTGAQVVGKNKKGRDITKVSDAPPDVNGIETFCNERKYKKYCDSLQVRAIYVDESEALGPANARYYASKLWGGETYFMQVDSHLQFAKNWDLEFIHEAKAAKSFPKVVLSSYPPGFEGSEGMISGGSKGSRLCFCEFSQSDVEESIIRISSQGSYNGGESRPRQIAFIAAGFFFARAEFLVDVPFDPFLPWCFMGEEILLSLRAWTSGWNIYAPRKNLIAHQYRPGRMGLPKFWGSVGRTWGQPGPGLMNQLEANVIDRIKYLVGYPESSKEKIDEKGLSFLLRDLDIYGIGSERSFEDYMKLTNINMQTKHCGHMKWCNNAELE